MKYVAGMFCALIGTHAAEILNLSTAEAIKKLPLGQLMATARPTVKVMDGEGFLQFDGKDDFLHLPGTGKGAGELTLFVVAAPRGNSGFFRALFATAPSGANDYVGGLNLDLGPNSTTNLSVVNVESSGSGGFADLLQPGFMQSGNYPFGGFHVFTVRTKAGEKGTELFVDGMLTGTRTRTESKIGMEHFVIGARLYSNEALDPFVQGFFEGDIAAVILHDTALADAERVKVEEELFARVPRLNAIASGEAGHALETLSNPPIVQMLSPGFTVHELPLKLSNINNLRYRHDGKLVALAYDGRIHLLTDTDGDGLEDKAEIFWDKAPLRSPLGMALVNDDRGHGVFVASKGKISLILDRDKDRRGDEEIIAASGWKEITHGVDTLGLAVDPKDGSIYFSISTENFIAAYVPDLKGAAQYKTNSDRSAIHRISKDFSTREIVATGLRFICGLAFNREGDLFATDQEGATWLPNGNPFDELLHIVPGRHYGFPPRHPKFLPNVIDEPSTFDYGPQHQSTVGLVFNEGVNGGPHFGPDHWQGDAIVCGESRGKIYRTKLVKTAHGYVAQNHLMACLGLLTVDACVTPQGDLAVACHSGRPDWGTGPAGEGRLFKIRYAQKATPQITAAWAAGPDEFRIAFDRPLDAADWSGAREKIRIEAGKFVSAGDRYEVIRPGYQVVRDQMGAPRRWVQVHTLSLSADRRALILNVPRQTEAVTYAITLPTPKAWLVKDGIEQRAEMDVALTLHGALAGDMVLPHPASEVSRALTKGSVDHEKFFASAATPEIQTRVDTSNIFVPPTQPGSRLDWDISKDEFANRKMTVAADYSYLALGEQKRPLPIARAFLPWAREASDKAVAAKSQVNGNWLNGKRLFFGAAACFACHTIRGDGFVFGPDLSNLVHRDRDSVLRDIAKPSAAINPDHIGSAITFKDGDVVTGMLKTLNDEKIVVRQAGDVETVRPRNAVASIEPMKASLMPEGIAEALSQEQMEDLLTFLLTTPLEPTVITRVDPPMPPARTREELMPFRLQPGAPTENATPMRILLCAGPKDHGPDEHDYPLWLNRWGKLLALAENVTVTTNMGFPSAELLSKADVTVFFSANPGWDTNTARLIDDYQKRGGGLVYLHYGVEGGKDHMALAERIGLAFYASAFRHGDMDLVFTNEHPITKGFSRVKFLDETYWAMRGDPKRIQTLATSLEDKAPRPQLWTLERENGRVFVCIPGHYMWTFDDPLFRILVFRGIAWAAKEENVDRFHDLVTVGARVAP